MPTRKQNHSLSFIAANTRYRAAESQKKVNTHTTAAEQTGAETVRITKPIPRGGFFAKPYQKATLSERAFR